MIANYNLKKTIIKKVGYTLAITVVIISILLPIYFLVKYAISDMGSINMDGKRVPIWPNHPTILIFKSLFQDPSFWEVVLNSTIISISTVILTMLLGVPAGYSLSRYKIPFSNVIPILLLSIRLFPDIVSIIPVTTVFIKLNLHSTYISVILAHTLLALPYIIFISKSSFDMISRDIENQAKVIGASKIKIFVSILMPMVIPSLIAGAIYIFLLSWGEFIFAHFLLSGSEIQTLTLYLGQLSFQPPQNVLAAISVCLSIPVIIFTLAIQKYMIVGSTVGAVK